MLPQGIQNPDLWGSISRSTNLAGSERDRGWEAVQEGYTDAMEPLDMRNARGVDGLGRVGALVANETSGRPERVDPQSPHEKGGGWWQCYRASESTLPMRI